MKTRPGFLILVLSSLLSGCANDIVVMAPYKSIPVVYCILNPSDTIQYLRLEKSFLGKGNAYDMAKQADSVYYPDAEVRIERWADGERKEQFLMERIALPARNSGIFLSDPNYLYRTGSELTKESEYRLYINIPSIGTELNAVTQVVSEFKVTKPPAQQQNLSFYSYLNEEKVEWITAPFTRIYQLALRFHYLEIKYLDTLTKSMDWQIGQYISQHGKGGETLTVNILHENFYKWIGDRMSPPPTGFIRLADKKAIDFIFTVGGEELYVYSQLYGDNSDISTEKPVYTNIANGIGLFSSRFKKAVTGKSLNSFSIDSLAKGMYTRHLGFDDSKNLYYLH